MTVNRRRIAPLLILPLVILLSSCVKVDYSAKISSVDKIELSVSLGLKKDAGGQALSPKELCSLLPKVEGSVEPSEFDDGTYAGCKFSGVFKLGAISEKQISYDKENQVWTFHIDGANTSGHSIDAEMISELSVSVTFPGRVLEASGKGKISGTTVTWSDPSDLLLNEGLLAKASNTGAPINWMLIGAGVIGVGAVAGGALYFGRVRRGKTSPVNQRPAPQGGPYPGPEASSSQPTGYPTDSMQMPTGTGSSPYQSGPGSVPQQPNATGYQGQPMPNQGAHFGSAQSSYQRPDSSPWASPTGGMTGGATSAGPAGPAQGTPDYGPQPGGQPSPADTPQPGSDRPAPETYRG